jgi:hypothetical protein
MQIPLSYADAAIGAAGASISHIRRHSCATVTIQESRGAPGEMAVEIIGTAQQLVQVPFLQSLLGLLKCMSFVFQCHSFLASCRFFFFLM